MIFFLCRLFYWLCQLNLFWKLTLKQAESLHVPRHKCQSCKRTSSHITDRSTSPFVSHISGNTLFCTENIMNCELWFSNLSKEKRNLISYSLSKVTKTLSIISISKLKKIEFWSFDLEKNHPRSNQVTPLERATIISYTLSIVTKTLISHSLRVISIFIYQNYEFCSFDMKESPKVKSGNTNGKSYDDLVFNVNSN